MKLYVQTEKWTETTREPVSDDNWDRGDTHSTWSIDGIFLTPTGNYDTIETELDVVSGDKVYLVYAIYSDGDSFGHDSCNRMELLSVHKNEDMARRNAETIGNNHIIHYDDGRILKMSYVPWNGYFENLDSITYDSFIVK